MAKFGSEYQPCEMISSHYMLLYRWDLWQPGLAIVDVTNPAAREWYKGKLRTLLDLGVDAFKVGFSVYI